MGFTLVELLVVVGIMGLSTALMAPVLVDRNNATHLERTLESLDNLEKAILGRRCDRVRGEVKFGGYASHMGALPELVDKSGAIVSRGGQPRGLWTRDIAGTPAVFSDDLPGVSDYTHSPGFKHFVRLGWRGPYMETPAGGAVADGWGTPFVFDYDAVSRDFKITSLAADGKTGGRGYADDIVRIIRAGDYLATVAGYISPHTVYHGKHLYTDKKGQAVTDIEFKIDHSDSYGGGRHYRRFPPGGGPTPVIARIYYRVAFRGTPASEKYGGSSHITYLDMRTNIGCQEVEVQPDGFFFFGGGKRIPVGSQRTLMISQAYQRRPAEAAQGTNWENVEILVPYKLHVGRGINWLEHLGSLP